MVPGRKLPRRDLMMTGPAAAPLKRPRARHLHEGWEKALERGTTRTAP
jgi:hypothetical protein